MMANECHPVKHSISDIDSFPYEVNFVTPDILLIKILECRFVYFINNSFSFANHYRRVTFLQYFRVDLDLTLFN